MRQRIELTGTNSSIGLIALISNAHTLLLKRLGLREMILVVGTAAVLKKNQSLPVEIAAFAGMLAGAPSFLHDVFSRTGGFSGGPVPDPISNSAVKLPSANGTKS